MASSKAHGSPDPPSVKSSIPWFSPSQSADHSKQSTNASDDKSTSKAKKCSSSAFGSTWGGGDSFWGRILVPCPSTSNQGGKGGEGGGERKTDGEEAPKPTPMSRGAGARKMKSSASPAVKSESGDKRRAVTSSSISSPPKSNSTPLLISR